MFIDEDRRILAHRQLNHNNIHPTSTTLLPQDPELLLHRPWITSIGHDLKTITQAPG